MKEEKGHQSTKSMLATNKKGFECIIVAVVV